MLFIYLTCLCLCRSLFAVDLFIYKSFTEIRQPHNGIGAYTYSFTNAEYGNIIDGSISWEGTPFIRQEIYNTIDSLKGAQVTVRRSTVCECETIQAKIVDPTMMLLENLDTGVYFYADSRSIEYNSQQPTDGGTTLTLQFKSKKTEHNGTLAYLIRSITWAPNYDLFVTNKIGCNLRAYANIQNNQQQQYTVDSTHLLGGDIQLASSASSMVFRPVALRSMAKSAMADNIDSTPIQLDGEQKGLYSYSLKDKYTLRPSSSIRLPFIDVVAKCRFYYKTSTSIGSGEYKGVFQRNYDLTPDHFLPAGILTIRDNEVLVGQANLPDVPENYTQTVSVGQDNDVRYSVIGNMTSSSDDKAPVLSRSYELYVNITNYKDKSVETQLDFYGAIQTILDDTTCKSATVNGNLLSLPAKLKPGGNLQCIFNVTLKWG